MRRTLLFWLLLPLLPLALWSASYTWRWPDLLPTAWTLRGWRYLASGPSGLGEAVWNSVAIAILVTLMALVVALPAGKALGQHQFRGKRLVELLFYLPILVPGAAAAMGLHPWFIRLGLSDTLLGVALVHLVPALPYMVRAAAAGYGALEPRLEEQARTLGASPRQALRWVILPVLTPALAAGAGLVFVISLSQYLLTLLIGGGRVITLPVLLLPFVAGGDRAIGAALSLVTTLPAILLFWLLDARLKRHALEVRL